MLWLHSLKVAQLLRSAYCLHTNQSRSYLNHLVHKAEALMPESIAFEAEMATEKLKRHISPIGDQT